MPEINHVPIGPFSNCGSVRRRSLSIRFNRIQIQQHHRTVTLRLTVNQKDTESESEGDRAERREETAEIGWNTTIRNEMRRVQTAH